MIRILTLCWLLAAWGCTTPQDPVKLSERFAPPDATPQPVGTEVELGLAGYAKVLCSAVFVSEREAGEAFRNSGFFFLPEAERPFVRYTVDETNQSVTLIWRDSIRRSARFIGDQGCVIDNGQGIFFEPVKVSTTLPDPLTLPWPMGDRIDDPSLPPEVDSTLLARAVEAAFQPPEALTAAFLVVYKGQIIGERYAPGIGKNTQLESWSMGKSLTATLIGRLIQQGKLQLEQPAPVPEWQSPGDPRGEITIRHLLQMSSGLRFTAHRDPEAPTYTRYLDHFYIYSGAVDAFHYSVNRPLQFPVGTEGRYRNCDPLTLGYIMRRLLGQDYWTYPQRELFDKIGIRRQVLETDPYGNFLLTGFDYGTARNWARLGLLYLQDGVWNGERLLPEGWSEFVSTPAPAWKEPVYGGLFWLNRNGEFPLPEDAYFMAGAGGQRTIIVPSKELVIVRMGHARGAEAGMEALNRACALLMEAI